MGMYDRILAKCPKCSSEVEFQSKTGPCALLIFTLPYVPPEVMEGVNSCSPLACDKCGSYLKVDGLDAEPYVVQVNRPVAEEKGEISYRKRFHVVPVNSPDIKICPTCSRRVDYESMEFLPRTARRCPTCGKK